MYQHTLSMTPSSPQTTPPPAPAVAGDAPKPKAAKKKKAPADAAGKEPRKPKRERDPALLNKGRVLHPIVPCETTTEEERELTRHCNKYIAEGDGVSIPKSIFRDLVKEIMQDIPCMGTNMKPLAVALLQVEAEVISVIQLLRSVFT